jgi:tRNA threonylcarbamoyladenosine biosynthesis protein TsaE
MNNSVNLPVLLTSSSVSQLPAIAAEIIAFAEGSRVFLFYGDMGAGKTTLIKSLCACLDVTDNVTSPTFSIVNEYKGLSGQKIYHFDFYRIKDQTEALDMGYEEYFYSGAYCFIEWPEKVDALLPESYVSVAIKVTGENTRQIITNKI